MRQIGDIEKIGFKLMANRIVCQIEPNSSKYMRYEKDSQNKVYKVSQMLENFFLAYFRINQVEESWVVLCVDKVEKLSYMVNITVVIKWISIDQGCN